MLKEYLSTIANAIRSKLGTTEKINAGSFPDKINDVYDKGRQDELSGFWNSFQQNYGGSDYAFYGKRWNDETFKPQGNIVTNGNAISMFQNCGITDLKGILENHKPPLKLLISGGANVQNMFNGSSITHLPEITPPYYCKGYYTAFANMKDLESIDKVTFYEAMTTDVLFTNCESLAHIVIDGVITVNFNIQNSPLTKASIISIVEHLSDSATGKTLVLNKMAVNYEFGINVDDETTFPEGSEYYRLRHSKDNWDFDYI